MTRLALRLVTNGIRLSCSFEDSLKDQQRWHVNELLANAANYRRSSRKFERPAAQKPE